MIVKKTGMVRKTNAVRMLGFSRRLFLKSTDHPRRARITLYHRRFGVHAASWMEPGGTLKWRPIQMPVGGLLVGMAGREDARLAEAGPTIWKPTGTPSDVTPPGKVSVGWPLMSKGAV